jgi:hypothetical protein
MSKAMNLDFKNLDAASDQKPDAATARRVATKAGSAEGFTGRPAVQPPTTLAARRTNHIQMNFKVPEEFREEFQTAFLAESSEDRSIRSYGEFLMKLFGEWQKAR